MPIAACSSRRRPVPFAHVQVARDATLADGLLAAAERAPDGRGVLVAGSGHVRRDRGVPFQLARRGVTAGIVTLAPVEVVAGETRPEAYGAPLGAKAPPFDYVWFTPRAKRGDPCAQFSK